MAFTFRPHASLEVCEDPSSYLVVSDAASFLFFAVPKSSLSIVYIYHVIRQAWQSVTMETISVYDSLVCTHAWRRQSLAMCGGKLTAVIYCSHYHLSVIYADFERFIWRRLYLIDGPQLPREIGCVRMLEVPAISIFSSDDTSAAAQQAASDASTLFCIVAKDYQTDTVCIQLYSSSSQRKCQLLPATRSTSTSTFSSSDFETSAVCIRSSIGPADAFPGDIMEPLTLAAGFNSNVLVFLYKSQFAAIDRLARFDIAKNVWQDSLVLTASGLNSRLPSSHDSGVVALSATETNRNGEFDCNDQRLFLCTVEIQRPLWRLKIWALDLQTQTMCVFAHMDLEQFYAEQRIHLSVTPDGCLLVALRYPWKALLEVWVNVPPLQLLCWNAIIQIHSSVRTMSCAQLHQLGIPKTFLLRYKLKESNYCDF